MIYAFIEDGQIKKRSTKENIKIKHESAPHLLSDSKLAEYGWLPIDRKEPSRVGRVVRYDTEVLKTKVNETPVVKVDERPDTKSWEQVIKGEEVDRGDWIEVPYTVETTSLEEYKTRKKSQLISSFSMEAGDAYPQTVQLLVLFRALDNNTTKEVEDYYKREGKKLEDALKLVDRADTHADVDAVEVE